MNNNCYNFKKILFNKGVFDSSIDATYIIHLENNGRLDNIKSQLLKYKLTKTVYIVFNKGFKKCSKDPYINISSLDLVDAFLKIFMDAKNKNYNNILILEDDFFFNDNINDKHICNEINNFIINKNNENFIYYLGCLPYLILPYNNNTKKILYSVGTHSCIYSKKMINNILNIDPKKITDWDLYHNLNSIRYTYNKPLCYQLFPDTENSKVWETYFFNLGYIGKLFYKKIKLDVQPEPGFTFFYTFSKYILLFIITIIILLIFILYKKYKKNIINNK
jgi:hypothetical protein